MSIKHFTNKNILTIWEHLYTKMYYICIIVFPLVKSEIVLCKMER